ncbi:MAG: HAMP domain-containing histidine kinase [Clostridiaceae bacterium]|nr:HAMP domain-containing histidine kinase [Clostridiaceae bacterium]
MIKKSIFLKLLALFLLFTTSIIGIFWLLHSQFFYGYYMQQKINTMTEYSEELQYLMGDDLLTQEGRDTLEMVADQIHGRVVLLDYDENILHYEGSIRMARASRVPQEALQEAKRGSIQTYKIVGANSPVEILAVLIPMENYIYLFQTPLQPIEEAITITRSFTFYLLIIAFFIAMVLSWIFSKTITKPLIKLNHVAAKMASLDFNEKWQEKRQDEIGDLGKTLNFLTEKLSSTIHELQQELKKEKNLEQMRKQFIANVSHELQTPIALISGYTEALQDGIVSDKEEVKAYLQIIEGETYRISNLVKDLLDLSQLQSGSFKVKVETVDILSLIDSTIDKFQLLTQEKKIKLFLQSSISEVFVFGDEYRIQQVLTNITQNAINNCNPEGSIIYRVFEEVDNILIEIYNEGPPIPEKELPFIWESFYKVKENRKGTGLGLAIVKNVLELHQSNYGVINKKNGVSFYFTLQKSFN